MLETPHVIVGAAIATSVGNPLLAVPLAFTSHFVLDMIPHWNPHLNTELRTHGKLTKQTKMIILADTSASILSGLAIASLVLPSKIHFATVLACCFAAALPDILEAPYYLMNYKAEWMKKYIAWQKKIQRDAEFWPGVAIQAIIIIAALWWIA